MAAPGRRDITIRRGDSYRHVVTLTTDGTVPIDITTRTYAAQVRTRPADDLVLAFTCAVTDGEEGEVTITATAAATADLPAGKFVWDLQETAGSDVTTILAGSCTIERDVTR